ncbi:hypothetical protein vseg_019830 [Gypsophila vaccaria]
MNSIKVCVDQLALMGKIFDPEDIIDRVLKGLDYETYKPVITTVRGRDTPIAFKTLHEQLLNHELLLKHDTATTQNHFTPSANPAYRQTNKTQQHGYFCHQHQPAHSQPATPNSTSNNPNHRTFKGRCQWCRQTGHVIANCSLFRKLFPTIVFHAPSSNRNNQPSPQANSATYGAPAPNPNYLLDNGASNHITHDLDTLAFHSPYTGLDDLINGDGSALPIENIGDFIGENPAPGPR